MTEASPIEDPDVAKWHDKYVAKFGTKYVGNKKYEKMKQHFIERQWSSIIKRNNNDILDLVKEFEKLLYEKFDEIQYEKNKMKIDNGKIQFNNNFDILNMNQTGYTPDNKDMEDKIRQRYTELQDEILQSLIDDDEKFAGIESYNDINGNEHEDYIWNKLNMEENEWFEDEKYYVNVEIDLNKPITIEVSVDFNNVQDYITKKVFYKNNNEDFLEAFEDALDEIRNEI